MSTVKHYALNAQETLRNSINAVIDEAPARDSDLLAFEIAIERGQNVVDDGLDHAQRMLRRHPALKVHVREQ